MNCCISITSVEDPNNTTPRPRPQLQTQRDRSSKWLKFYPIFKLQIKDKHILQITPRVLENYPDLSDFSFSGQLRDVDSFSSMLGNRQLHCTNELYCAPAPLVGCKRNPIALFRQKCLSSQSFSRDLSLFKH